MYHPEVGDSLLIDHHTWYVLEHPALPGRGITYGQEGRAGTVYQLADDDGNLRALKVFKPAYRQPSLVGLTQKLAPFAALPGLTICERAVLTPQQHGDLLREHPDLLYAGLMPWIDGQTWQEIAQQPPALSPEQSLGIAQAFLAVLTQLEQQGVAHGDLSDSNFLVFGLRSGSPHIELVDVEQLYGPGLAQPPVVPGGSPGYAHRSAGSGLWEPAMDRFAGAVLLAEMLSWHDERVREAATGSTYFSEGEMQQDCPRYQLMHTVLSERWGESVAALFEQAWASDTVAQCPPFGAWLVALPASLAEEAKSLDEWLVAGQVAAAKGDWPAAIAAYRSAQALVEPGSGLVLEIPLIISEIEGRMPAPMEAENPPVVTREGKSAAKKAVPWLWFLVPLLLIGAAVAVVNATRAINGREVAAASQSVSTSMAAVPTKRATSTRVSLQPTSGSLAAAVIQPQADTKTPEPPSQTPKPAQTQVPPSQTPEPSTKVLFLDHCDPRTSPDFCQVSSSLEIFDGFYGVLDELGLTITYDIFDTLETGTWDEYAIVIADCGGVLSIYDDSKLAAALKDYILSGGSFVVMANNACRSEDIDAATAADSFTRQFGIYYSDEDLANDSHTFAEPITSHPIVTGVDRIYQYRYTILDVESPASTVVTLEDRPVVAVYDGDDGTIVALTSNLDWGPSPSDNDDFDLDPQLRAHYDAIDQHLSDSDNFVFWKSMLHWLLERSTMKRAANS
jgi:hypothetical protein